jgi:serine/threonine protein kinase
MKRGNFELGRLLGKGSYGKVWRASPSPPAAVDCCAIKEVAVDPFFGIEGLRELDICMRLRHPHLMSCREFFFAPATEEATEATSLYLVMDLAEGTLYERLTAFEEADRPRLMREMCSALAYLHANNVHHCDIKPENMLVFSDGHLRVADTGIAQYATSPFDFDICQSPQYAPPEVLAHSLDAPTAYMDEAVGGRANYDRVEPLRGAADMWALGCCLAYVASGRNLFRYGPYGDKDAKLGAQTFGALPSGARPSESAGKGDGPSPPSKEEDAHEILTASLARRVADFLAGPDRFLEERGVRDPRLRGLIARMMRPLPAERVATIEAVLSDLSPGSSAFLAPTITRRAMAWPGRLMRESKHESGMIVGWMQEVAEDFELSAETFVLGMDLLYRSYDHFVVMARDEGMRAPRTERKDYRVVIQQLALVCMYVAGKLTMCFPVRPKWYVIADVITVEGIVWLERELVRHLGGSLYPPNAYTCAFSLWSLREAFPLVVSPVMYPQLSVDPQAWMDALEAREGERRREARQSKEVAASVLFGGLGKGG